MADLNPYASPQSAPETALDARLVEPLSATGLWQKGRLLVMHRDAPLPSVCIKSNTAADGRLTRKLNWHHPALIIVLLMSPLIYIILALLLTKRARIEIGLSEPYFARRRRDILIGWSTVLLGLAAIVAGFANLDGNSAAPLLLAGFTLFLGGAIYGLLRARMVSADRITADYIWLKGVHPDILAPLPLWPYQP
jgi:hypothetical protein